MSATGEISTVKELGEEEAVELTPSFDTATTLGLQFHAYQMGL